MDKDMDMDMVAISWKCSSNAFFQGQTTKQPPETREKVGRRRKRRRGRRRGRRRKKRVDGGFGG